jgi:hypothetical protein
MSGNPYEALGVQGLRPEWEQALPDYMRDALDRERAAQAWRQAQSPAGVEWYERVGRVLLGQKGGGR